MSGSGIQPAGRSPAGVGTPGTAASNVGVVLRDGNSGLPQAGRYIDANSRQYVFDASGRTLGTTETRQLVALAVNTNRGSSTLQRLGSELYKVQTITDNFGRRVSDVFTDALADLVSRKLIQVVDITATQTGGSRATILIRWIDLTTGTEERTAV